MLVGGSRIHHGRISRDDAAEISGRLSDGVGYAIARAHWGRGITVEAATAAIEWAVAEHDLTEIWASTDVAHVRSRRVMEKLGMTFDRGDEREVVYRLRR